MACRFCLLTSLVYGLGLIFVLSPFCWSACRMTRGQEANSTSQEGRKQGPIQGTPSISSIISSLTIEELRAYYDVPDNIDLGLMEEPDESTMGREHNAVFFTREHHVAELRFPIQPLSSNFCILLGRSRPSSIPTPFRL